MIGMNIIDNLENNIRQAVLDFESRDDITTKFGEPVIGYANTRSLFFDMMFSRGLSDHPKNIYRPGNTVIIHFVPYAAEIVAKNEGTSKVCKSWGIAFRESMWLSMRINGVIRETLDMVGRLSSCTNTPIDWDDKRCHENWSHKMAAYIAGMGTFGPSGSLHTKNGYGGRFGSIITDGLYAPDCVSIDNDELERVYKKILRDSCFKGSGAECSQEMIACCPAGAIDTDGIDRKKCQAHCKSIDETIPSPDVCGKCFPFK